MDFWLVNLHPSNLPPLRNKSFDTALLRGDPWFSQPLKEAGYFWGGVGWILTINETGPPKVWILALCAPIDQNVSGGTSGVGKLMTYSPDPQKN